jgi:hypothetical protein
MRRKMRNTTTTVDNEFDRLLDTACDCSFDTLVQSISGWIRKTTQPSSQGSQTLSPCRSRRLLDKIVLGDGIDITEKINMLVEDHRADVNSYGTEGTRSADILSLAVAAERHEAVTVLLSNGADPNARYSLWGRNTFVYASKHNLTEMVKGLRLYGANLWQMNEFGETAMIAAVKNSSIELVEFFLKEGVSPNWYDVWDNMTLLHHATSSMSPDSTDVIRILLAAGGNPHHRTTGGGHTPLEYISLCKAAIFHWRPLDEQETALLDLNASVLCTHMANECNDLALAVCMSTHDRLGSGIGCNMYNLAVEPGIFQMIMANVYEEFDENYPLAPIRPTGLRVGNGGSVVAM